MNTFIENMISKNYVNYILQIFLKLRRDFKIYILTNMEQFNFYFSAMLSSEVGKIYASHKEFTK